MATTIHQPSANPTNKLSAATVSAAVMAVFGMGLKKFAPDLYDPEVLAALTPVVLYIAGWLIPDAPQIQVITQEPDHADQPAE